MSLYRLFRLVSIALQLLSHSCETSLGEYDDELHDILIAHECCLKRGTFPLFTPALYRNLGYPQASSLLGALAFAFSILPFLLMAYGPQIRRNSRVAKQIAWQQDKRIIEAQNNRLESQEVQSVITT